MDNIFFLAKFENFSGTIWKYFSFVDKLTVTHSNLLHISCLRVKNQSGI